MAKDVLNRRALADDQERILNSVLNPTYNGNNKPNMMNIVYITAIVLCIAAIKQCMGW